MTHEDSKQDRAWQEVIRKGRMHARIEAILDKGISSANRDSPEDIAAQNAMRSKARKSLSILEKSFITNGSGRYVILREK